jgi:A/G-specific adenine glycosylase
MLTPARFNEIIAKHYKDHGRHDMPWRKTRDPFKILVSEVMLQQTQVGRVRPFYENFIKKFPNFESLAHAKTDDVLRVWQGLGYNRRAIALQKLSKIVLEKFHGRLPRTREELESLPGIGRGTSGSVAAFAFNRPEIFIETNIRRVFIHFFFPKQEMVTDAELERYIKRTIDAAHPREWYWAIMDYGSWLAGAARPGFKASNPNRRSARYMKQSTFKGSDRELRGKILRFLLAKKKANLPAIAKEVKEPKERIRKVTRALSHEGFLGIKGEQYCINK